MYGLGEWEIPDTKAAFSSSSRLMCLRIFVSFEQFSLNGRKSCQSEIEQRLRPREPFPTMNSDLFTRAAILP